jgi:hypothetical protein
MQDDRFVWLSIDRQPPPGRDEIAAFEEFRIERLYLKPLPAWIPKVYRLQQR